MFESKTINMRLVEEKDAEFILSLRLDDTYNKYLSKVNADVDAQREWIKKYKKDESKNNQFYFIIERKDGTPCGTVRVYDMTEESFCWGSWILNENKTRFAAIESAIMVYDFGFNTLNYRKSHFEVIKNNSKVVSFHKKFGAIQVGEDNVNYYFEISRESVENSKRKFKNLYE